MDEWWNVDIRPFKGVDEVADVTAPWPWRDLDYVYGEHFLEHLALDDALTFLSEAIAHLRPGGRIRLSTPGLEWVWQTHFASRAADDAVVADTYRANRAFHGWGHQFLYSRPFLEKVLTATGYTSIEFFPFGESDDPELSGLERHGTPTEAGGWPSVWNVEAARPATGEPAVDGAIRDEIEQEFVRYVRSGH
jgi:predicted SAM-dependent methyltransferase